MSLKESPNNITVQKEGAGSNQLSSACKEETRNILTELDSIDPMLKKHARILTGGDVHRANDLMQDTILKALVGQEKFKPGTNFKAWIFTIMRFHHYSEWRKKQKREVVNTDDYMLEDNLSTGKIESDINLEDLYKIINNSLEEKKLVIFSLWYEGYKIREIAMMLEIPEGTVKSSIFFARKILMEKIGIEKVSSSLHTRD